MKKLYILFALALMGASVATATPRKAMPRKTAPQKVASSKPKTLPASEIQPNGFTANWQPYAGASLYQVNVYEPITVTEAGAYTVLEEGFWGVEVGNFLEPYDPGDYFVDLSENDMAFTPDWQGLYPIFAEGMVGGIVYSPYIDLTNDGGKFTVRLEVAGWGGAMVKLTSSGATDQTVELHLTETGLNEFEVEFTNGCHDTYLTFVDYGITNDPNGEYMDKWDFLDNIEIIQNLEAGDTFLRFIELYETPEDSGITSHGFYDMKYLDGANHLAYDVMAISVYYNDPYDDWDYDIDYSDYSDLEHVTLNSSAVNAIETEESNAPAEYFDLRGVKMSGELAPGLYIRRQGEKAEKVYIK